MMRTESTSVLDKQKEQEEDLAVGAGKYNIHS